MFPLLIPVLAAGALPALRRRGYPVGSTTALAVGLLTLGALLIAGGGSWRLSFWRPVDLFGDGLAFRIDAAVLPFALIAAALAGRQQGDGETTELRLLQLAVALAAIAADNLLTVMISWSVLALWGNWRQRNLWLPAAIAPLFAAAALSEEPLAIEQSLQFLAVAAVLLSRGADRPYLSALPAFALLSRQPLAGAGLLLIGAAAVVIATLAGSRWLPAGLLGLALLSGGMPAGVATATLRAGALALIVIGNLEWVQVESRRWISGLLVGGLPLLVAITAGGQSPSLLTIPAAALLAAPIIGATTSPTDGRPVRSRGERLVAAVPAAVCLAVLAWSIDRVATAAVLYGLGAMVLAVLTAAGPRWLYRQPAYTRFAGNALRVVGGWLVAGLERLTAAVRAANRVLEGESSTVWLLVILLVLAQALGG